MEAAAQVLIPFLGGLVLGAVGVALTFRRLQHPPGHDPAKITFHRPREGVLVVEIRQDLSETYASSLREWLEDAEGKGTRVLVVALGDRV